MVVGFNLIGWWQKTLWKPIESPATIQAFGVAGEARVATEQGLLPFDWVALAWLRHWGKILLDSHHIHHVFGQ